MTRESTGTLINVVLHLVLIINLGNNKNQILEYPSEVQAKDRFFKISSSPVIRQPIKSQS